MVKKELYILERVNTHTIIHALDELCFELILIKEFVRYNVNLTQARTHTQANCLPLHISVMSLHGNSKSFQMLTHILTQIIRNCLVP